MRHFDRYLLDAETPAQRLAWLFCTDTCSGIDKEHVLHFVSEMLTVKEVIAFGRNAKLLAQKHGRGVISEFELATEVAKLFSRYWIENGATVFPDSKELAIGKVSYKVS